MAAISKTMATASTFPYQVVRSRLQDHRGLSHYSGVIDVLRQTFQREGLQGFYRGLTPNILRVLPGTCITFAVYESLSRLMKENATIHK